MKNVLAWFARNSVAANLLMFVIVVGGFTTLFGLKMEVFPEFTTGMISVSVELLGATPEEVEEGIVAKIEEEIQDVVGIEKITSTAAEGLASILIELENEADSVRALDDIKLRIDAIDTFPEEAEEPVIQELLTRSQVINLAVAGDTDEFSLKTMAERIRDDLLALPQITQVKMVSARPYEISVEVSEDALRKYELTFDQVARAIRTSSLDLPGGAIKTSGGDILLRTKGQAYRGSEFEQISLITREDGTRVTLGEIAEVIDGFEDVDQSTRFNGKPAVLLQIFRVGNQNAIDVADAVIEHVESIQDDLPAGLLVETWQDNSAYLKSRTELLLKNAFYGFILVFLILALFLRFKLALWTCVGISISFLGAIWMMPTLGVSINMISLFAFILVLGIVVDDAIVVGESIYTRQRRGQNPLQAAIDGVSSVSRPVIFAVFTSVAAMIPLLSVSGTTGKIMSVIPLIVIPALLFSLVESLFVLPSHLGHSHSENGNGNFIVRFQQGFASLLERFIDHVYRPVLETVLRWRYLSISVALATLILTAGIVGGGHIKFTFFPNVDADFISAYVDLPLGSPFDETERVVRRLEKAALEMEKKVQEREGVQEGGAIRHMLASAGEQPQRTLQAMNGGQMGVRFVGSHMGEVTIELELAENRTLTNNELIQLWREGVGDIPELQDITFTSSIFSAGKDIEIELTHRDLETLEKATHRLEEMLAAYPGVYEVSSTHESGKMELELDIRPEGEVLGLTRADLGNQVRQAFYGEEAQRIQRGRDEIRVMVRYPREERRSLQNLEEMRIRAPSGVEVPFPAVARTDFGLGYSTINRRDRQRTITVYTAVDATRANANEILDELEETKLPGLLRDVPGLKVTYEGQRADQAKTMRELLEGIIFAVFLIYTLLAIPFKSYLQPFIVVSAIPFGLVGAVWGHFLMGVDLTILSMFGLVALTGVVVNDSLVLVDYINQQREEKESLLKAVRDAGAARFRPILLTSLTTFGGLTPLLLETSVQAQFLIPMGITLGFGILFATFIILLIIPSMYFALEDIKRLFRWLYGRSDKTGEESVDEGRESGAEAATTT